MNYKPVKKKITTLVLYKMLFLYLYDVLFFVFANKNFFFKQICSIDDIDMTYTQKMFCKPTHSNPTFFNDNFKSTSSSS